MRTVAANTLSLDNRLILTVLPAPSTGRPERFAASQTRSTFDRRWARPSRIRTGPGGIEAGERDRAYYWQRQELPLMFLAYYLPIGANADPDAQAGETTLMASMLEEGAGKRDAEQFQNALDLLGASVIERGQAFDDSFLETPSPRISNLRSRFSRTPFCGQGSTRRSSTGSSESASRISNRNATMFERSPRKWPRESFSAQTACTVSRFRAHRKLSRVCRANNSSTSTGRTRSRFRSILRSWQSVGGRQAIAKRAVWQVETDRASDRNRC